MLDPLYPQDAHELAVRVADRAPGWAWSLIDRTLVPRTRGRLVDVPMLAAALERRGYWAWPRPLRRYFRSLAAWTGARP